MRQAVTTGHLRGLIEWILITPEGQATRVEFVGQIANMLIVPSPPRPAAWRGTKLRQRR